MGQTLIAARIDLLAAVERVSQHLELGLSSHEGSLRSLASFDDPQCLPPPDLAVSADATLKGVTAGLKLGPVR